MMKKILAGLLIAVMLLTGVSCKKNEGDGGLSDAINAAKDGDEDVTDIPENDSTQDETDPDVSEPDEEDASVLTPEDLPSEENKTPEKEETKEPVEDNKTDDTGKTEEEQKPEEEKKPEDEQKPEEDTTPTSKYPGTAVEFATESVKISYMGSYLNLSDLAVRTSGGENLFLLNTVDGVDRFNSQVSAWMDTSSGNEEEEDYEEVVVFNLQQELGRIYGDAFFEESSLLLLSVSGTAGTVKGVTVEGSQLNLWMTAVASGGTGVLGDMSTSIVAVEVPRQSIAECSLYKVNTVTD